MKNNLLKLLPSITVTLSLFVLPLVLTFYFIFTQYSQNFIAEQEITYFDVQSSWLGQLVVGQQYLTWFNRFMDFAFWGVLALVVLVGIWAFGSTKVSLQNHYAQEGFQNFRQNKVSWHERFFVVFLLRCSLVILILYSLFAIAGKYIPQLSANISQALIDREINSYVSVLFVFLILFAYQYLIAVCVKLFKYLSAE